MEFTRNQITDAENNEREIRVLIPEGLNTLWITKFQTRRDKDNQKRRFNKKGKRRNIKELDYWYITDVELTDKKKTGSVMNTILFWNEKERIIDWLDFARAGQADSILLDEGKRTERVKILPENRADDDTLPGIVGRAIEVQVAHLEKELILPKKDDAGNPLLDSNGKWIMEVQKDDEGNTKTFIREMIKRDENWRLGIKKSENTELFFLEEEELDLDLDEEDNNKELEERMEDCGF